MGFPGGTDTKESACNAGLIPGLERSPGGGNGKSLQYSCLENSMDRGACRMHTVQWVAELDITKQLTLSPCVYLHVHNYFLEISESVLYTYL